VDGGGALRAGGGGEGHLNGCGLALAFGIAGSSGE
jgi:hypothetical protein